MNESVNVRVLPAFGLQRCECFTWQECGGETHCWREKDLRPGAAGACISALHEADGREKQH